MAAWGGSEFPAERLTMHPQAVNSEAVVPPPLGPGSLSHPSGGAWGTAPPVPGQAQRAPTAPLLEGGHAPWGVAPSDFPAPFNPPPLGLGQAEASWGGATSAVPSTLPDPAPLATGGEAWGGAVAWSECPSGRIPLLSEDSAHVGAIGLALEPLVWSAIPGALGTPSASPHQWNGSNVWRGGPVPGQSQMAPRGETCLPSRPLLKTGPS